MPLELPVAHTPAFRRRRFLNWFPLGLTYAFLYMGRYNLTVSKNALGDLMTKEDFGVIFGVGTLVYGVAFLLNGPLTDKIGGKRAILIAAFGSAVMNSVMGLYIQSLVRTGASEADNLRLFFSLMYAANMYFQSFGAVSIVKVNSHWFHVRERGGFSGIFGTMIASGIWLAFTVNGWLLMTAAKLTGTSEVASAKWVFFAPAAVLATMFVIELFLLKDRPGLAGFQDFDTGDASSGEEGAQVSMVDIIKRIITNPIVLTVALVEFCTGVLRNGVMHWYPIYAKEVLVLPREHALRDGSWGAWYFIAAMFAVGIAMLILASRVHGKRKAWLYVSGGVVLLIPFVQGGWGGLLMVAGVIGGNVAGWVSDLFFQSRRAPAAGGLYALLVVSSIVMVFVLGGSTQTVGWTHAEPAEGEDGLRSGDTIVSIAGESDIDGWIDVSRAVKCLPADCQGKAQWDVERCMCATKPERVAADLTPSNGLIPAKVERNGETVSLMIPDPKPSMRAGDRRTLKAGPRLAMSPLWLGIMVFIMSLAVIGTHGLLSGTATMDFGGRRGAATAVGLIDGFVYLGTAVQSISLGYLTSISWSWWPVFLLPFGVIGFLLLLRIWNAKPKAKQQPVDEPEEPSASATAS